MIAWKIDAFEKEFEDPESEVCFVQNTVRNICFFVSCLLDSIHLKISS